MAAANASARGQRSAILASPLHELTGFCLAVDCLNPDCRRDRMFAVAELASFYGGQRTVGEVLSPHALLGRLWRARRGCLAGDRADHQRPRQAATGAPAGAEGEGVAAACTLNGKRA
jgi:hypothetical protein